MIDNKIMYEIIEKLHESFSASISICDVSGRVIVSTDSSCMGEMNLLAIEALNINSKVTVSMDSKIQKAGAAMPLRFQKSRMGAVVLQGAGSSSRLAGTPSPPLYGGVPSRAVNTSLRSA